MIKDVTPQPRKVVAAWCLYDWANSAFSTVILTFVFSVYFAKGIAVNEVTGSAQWGYAIGFAGLCVAIISPIFGIMLDFRGNHHKWLASLTICTSFAIASLVFMQPELQFVMPTLLTIIFCIVGFELCQVVYNAMLPKIAEESRIGRISGQAWALGYGGGLVCLALALVLLVGFGEGSGLLGITEDGALNIRATAILTAVWFVGFSLPLLTLNFLNKDEGEFKDIEQKRRSSATSSLITGVIMAAFSDLKALKNIVRFLIASALYRDGLATLFAVGGLYAAGTFGMEFSEILMFGIGLNISAGLGAYAFSFMDDKSGSKRVITLSLVALIVLGIAIILVQDKAAFMAIALTLGIFVGPVQAASRTLLARISPPEKVSEMFGLYALSGKSISFMGPILFALLTNMFQSQRAGLLGIIFFWCLGLYILRKVQENQIDPSEHADTIF